MKLSEIEKELFDDLKQCLRILHKYDLDDTVVMEYLEDKYWLNLTEFYNSDDVDDLFEYVEDNVDFVEVKG